MNQKESEILTDLFKTLIPAYKEAVESFRAQSIVLNSFVAQFPEFKDLLENALAEAKQRPEIREDVGPFVASLPKFLRPRDPSSPEIVDDSILKALKGLLPN